MYILPFLLIHTPPLKDACWSNPLKCPGKKADLAVPSEDLQGVGPPHLFWEPIPQSQSLAEARWATLSGGTANKLHSIKFCTFSYCVV